MHDRSFTDRDGVEVFAQCWPADRPRGIVVIAHGMSEHSDRYARFAEALSQAGWATYALDHRGHGRTATSTGAGKMGPDAAGDALVEDLHQLIGIASDEVPGVPVVVFGHSMGTMITQAYRTRYGSDLAGYVLSGSPGPMPDPVEAAAGIQALVDAGLADEHADLFSAFNDAFAPTRTPSDWLSRDAHEVDLYVADPMCGSDNLMTYGFLAGLVPLAAPAMEPAGIAQIPPLRVLMITGERDPVSEMADNVRELERRLRDGGLDVTAHYYPEARHELLNETNRDEVTADVLAWLATIGDGAR